MRTLFADRTSATSILLTFLITTSCSFAVGQAVFLSPDPGGSTACKPITLQATVNPHGAGTVQFFETAGGRSGQSRQPAEG